MRVAAGVLDPEYGVSGRGLLGAGSAAVGGPGRGRARRSRLRLRAGTATPGVDVLRGGGAVHGWCARHVQPVCTPASIAPSSLPHNGFPDCRDAMVLVQVVCARRWRSGRHSCRAPPGNVRAGDVLPLVGAEAAPEMILTLAYPALSRAAQAVEPGAVASVISFVPAAEVAGGQAMLFRAGQPVQHVADVGAGEQRPVLPHPGAHHCSPYSNSCGLIATACSAIANLYPALQLMCSTVCSMLGSAPSEELPSLPISSFSNCSDAP
jgi:hypothetical protein